MFIGIIKREILNVNELFNAKITLIVILIVYNLYGLILNTDFMFFF